MRLETTVAVVATRPETVLADYARLLGLAGVVEAAETAGERGWHLLPVPPRGPAGPAAACPPWQLEGVLRALLEAGHQADDIALALPDELRGEQPPLGAWRRVLAACGAETAPCSPAELPPASSRLLLANLRTDRRFGVGGSMAAFAGALSPESGASERLDEDWRRHRETVAGAVIDATVAGDGSLAGALVPVAAHLLLASRDPVAVDAVACRLTGLSPRRVPWLQRLDRAGLGCADLDAITLLGDVAALPASLDLVAARRFHPGHDATGPRWWRRWREKLSDRWPRPLARRRAARRYETQPWGRLHAEYDRRGVIGGGED